MSVFSGREHYPGNAFLLKNYLVSKFIEVIIFKETFSKDLPMKILILASLITLSSCAQIKSSSEAPIIVEEDITPENPATPKTITEAVNSPFRNEIYKKRDKYRNPVDTLTFFGVKPTMRVLEITPGAGWYTEILAPFLSERGQYIIAVHPLTSPAPKSNYIELWSKKYPEVGGSIQSVIFNPSDVQTPLSPEASLDMILTFRNLHNWMAAGTEANAFKLFFDALKAGGILGVVDHRAPESQDDPKAANGYVRESDTIKMARAAGFKYLGKSEVNYNPKDTKDHPKGVWSLPPTYALKDTDKEKYEGIGESDRFTLKFSKP